MSSSSKRSNKAPDDKGKDEAQEGKKAKRKEKRKDARAAFALLVYHTLPKELRLANANVVLTEYPDAQLQFGGESLVTFHLKAGSVSLGNKPRQLNKEATPYLEDASSWCVEQRRQANVGGPDWKDGLCDLIVDHDYTREVAKQWLQAARFSARVATSLDAFLCCKQDERARFVKALERVCAPYQLLYQQVMYLEREVTVTVPADSPIEEWADSSFDADVLYVLPQCQGLVVCRNDTQKTKVIPQSYVGEVAPLQPKEYQIADNIPKFGGKWKKAEILADLPNDQQLLQLPEFNMSNWWDGYEVVDKDSVRVREPVAKKKKAKK